MRKNKVIVYVLVTFVMLLVICLSYYVFIYRAETTKKLHISLIAYGNSSDAFEMLENGMKQSTAQTGRRVSYEFHKLLASGEMDARDQMILLEREVESGADQIVLVPMNTEYTLEYLAGKKWKTPILFLETGMGVTEGYPEITANHYAMGHLLAEKLAERENPEAKIAIIRDHMDYGRIRDRYMGAYDELLTRGQTVVFWERNETEAGMDSLYFLQRAMVEEAVDVVVALDNESTEAVADAAENLNKSIRIYGIANSNKAVNYLDKEMISLLIYENEFNVGYLAMQQIAGKKQVDYERFMEYRAIEKADMYSEENQKLIFPFVK